MMSNAQYARVNHLPSDNLPAEFEDFAAFTIELPSGEDLWAVTPRKAEAEVAPLVDERAANLEKYIRQGYAFDERASTDPSGGEDEETTEQEYTDEEQFTYFMASRSTHKGSDGRRGGRIASHNSFEGLVDAAQ